MLPYVVMQKVMITKNKPALRPIAVYLITS